MTTKPANITYLRTCKKCGFTLTTVDGKDICPRQTCKLYGKEQ